MSHVLQSPMVNPSEAEIRDPAAAAAYVATFATELAALARRHGLDTLGYLLDMARLEAENAARHPALHS